MKILGNIIWVVFGGLEMAVAYFCIGLLLMITIIGIPFGIQIMKLAGLVGVPWWKDGSGGDTRRSVETGDMGGIGDAHRGGAVCGNCGMGLPAVPFDYALLPLPRRERASGAKGARGSEVAQQG